VHVGRDLKDSARLRIRLKASREGLVAPEAIRRIRRRLGLSQAEAGELVGGGPRAFQKYEAGDLLPSRAISSALTLLNRDPGGLEILKTTRTRLGRAS
jgi:HTH-type transcriptional regulator/antitoxin MqsA